MRILLAEDEDAIARALRAMLEKAKYTVDVAATGTEALDAILLAGPEGYGVLVLDIMMPGMSGLEVLRRARAAGITTPALFLTARGEVEDRVAGLDAGADDYLAKPFAASELLARIRALGRRAVQYAAPALTVGNTSLDCAAYTLRAPGGTARLNNKEYQIAELFFRHPQQVFSSAQLMDTGWNPEADIGADVVWTYIGFLRKKLREIGSDASIKTIRGAGYALEGPSC